MKARPEEKQPSNVKKKPQEREHSTEGGICSPVNPKKRILWQVQNLNFLVNTIEEQSTVGHSKPVPKGGVGKKNKKNP